MSGEPESRVAGARSRREILDTSAKLERGDSSDALAARRGRASFTLMMPDADSKAGLSAGG